MPSHRVVRVRSVGDGVAAEALRAGIARIQSELERVAGLPAGGGGGGGRRGAGAPAAGAGPHRPRRSSPSTRPGSMDLDQALHLERDGDGFVVHYAIADVAAFVPARRPGRRRGQPARRDAVRRRLARSRCTRRCSARTPRRCCPSRSGPRCCGRSGSAPTAARTDVHVRAGAGALAGPAHLRGGAARDRRRHGRPSRSRCCARSASCGSPARPSAAASRCRCPSRRSTSRGRSGTWSSASSCPSSAGTPSSRCSPASPPPT